MEHTYTHRKNAWSAREHRLLFFEKANPAPRGDESADNARVNVDSYTQKVEDIAAELKVLAGGNPDNRTEEAKLQSRMLEISQNFEVKSAKIIATMNTHRELRVKAAMVLDRLLEDTQRQMREAKEESGRIAADRKKDAEEIVTAQKEGLREQQDQYTAEKKTADEGKDVTGRAVQYAEDEASATIEQIRALADSIDTLLPLTSDKVEKAKLTKEREQLIVDEITIFAELAGLQQRRRETLKPLAVDENSPKTAVDERLDAASEQLQRAAYAREKANTAALKPGISGTTARALTRKADTLFDSMAEVHREKTQIASNAHDEGKISLDDFTSVLQEEIDFLDAYNRRDVVGFRLSLDKLVIDKAVKMVTDANDEENIDKKKAAREEAVRFIDSAFGRASIQEGKRSSLRQAISNAQRAEVETAATTRQAEAEGHREEQTFAAQELLRENPIVDLHTYIKDAGTVLAEDNLGQYLYEDEYKGITDLANSLAEKIVAQIETDITSLDRKVEELYDAATNGKTVPEKFEETLGEVTRVSNNVELYNGSPLARLKRVDSRKIQSRESYRSCFVSIVRDYVKNAAVTAKDAAKDAATFRKAFEVVKNAEKVIETNSKNLNDLIGVTYFGSIFTIKTELEEKLASAISRTSSATERAALRAVQLEQQEAGDPYSKIRLSLLIESEQEEAVKEAEGAAIGNRMGGLRNADIIVADREVLATLQRWLTDLEKASPTDPKNNVGTEIKAGTTYWDRDRCYRTAPTYGPSYRTQVQDYLRSQLQKTNQMQERHQKDSLTQEVSDVTKQLRSELMRWMTPEQNLREAQVEWVGERSAIDRVLIGVEDIRSFDDLNKMIEKASTLQTNLNQNPFSVRNKLASTGFLPESTPGKSTFSKEVEKKHAQLQTALDHAKNTLIEVDAELRAQGNSLDQPAPPSEPNKSPPPTPDFAPPPPDDGNNGSSIQ